MNERVDKRFRKTINEWFDDRGDQNYLRNYQLTKEDVVVDVGAYKGQWLIDMNNRYGCKCIGFEPINDFIKGLQLPESIIIHDFALGLENSEEKISIKDDGSSITKEGEYTITIKDAKDFIKNKEIAVLMINIEGYEYDLVPYLINNKCLDLVNNIQIQFHKIPGIKRNYMRKIIKDLNQIGFTTKFDYEFVWWGGSRIK